MKNIVGEKIAQHKRTGKGGLVSICSAHPAVIKAAAKIAQEYDEILLVESTSNQVDQFGGYTGQTPKEYIAATRALIEETGFPVGKLVFGGDHLGPNAWQHLPAEEAMANADELIRQYAAAGYEKIHLDCSMSCADDPVPLSDEIVATRAARLCKIAEDVRAQMPDAPKIVYIIGTEVPVPGGAQEDLAEGVVPTSADAARTTYAVHERIFAENGLSEAWTRVVGLVVQPGVEFDHHQIVDYVPEKARDLVAVADEFPYATFEAHSTDYQAASAFKSLVSDHFAILKVGPALTFAYREALFALSDAVRDFIGAEAVDVRGAVETAMLQNPDKWQKYYHGSVAEQKVMRAYSLSDRVRYYWPQPDLQQKVDELYKQVDAAAMPFGLLHQYLPSAVERCHERGLPLDAAHLIEQHICLAIQPYMEAVKGE